MAKFFQSLTVILLSFLILQSSAQASLTAPALRAGIGHSMLTGNAGIDSTSGSNSKVLDNQSLGTLVTLNPSFLWDISTMRSKVGFQFIADLGSPYGFVTVAGIGLTAIFYPFGLSSTREIAPDFSVFIKSRISPYFQVSITQTKFTIYKPDPAITEAAKQPHFSAALIETSIGLGLDYPVQEDLVAFAGLHYRSALYANQETQYGKISYGGIALIMGVMTNFY